MTDHRIKIGETIPLETGGKQFRPTVKSYIVDEWRAMGFHGVDQYREGLRLVFEPVDMQKVKEAP